VLKVATLVVVARVQPDRGLDFLAQRENVIVVASHGLGKTMLAKNLVHQAILAGHSARFLTAADLILDLRKQDTARALQHRLRTYMRPALLAIDEVGYLSYDAHAADLLFKSSAAATSRSPW
jgi:DNA replication protein DnaC